MQLYDWYYWITFAVTLLALYGLPKRNLAGSFALAWLGFALWPLAVAAYGVSRGWWPQPRRWFSSKH